VGAVPDAVEEHLEERRRLGGGHLGFERVLDVLDEPHGPVHPLALVAERPQLLGEDQLVERHDERHARDDRAHVRLKEAVERIRGDDVGLQRRGAGDADSYQREVDAGEQPARDDPSVAVHQYPDLRSALIDPSRHRVFGATVRHRAQVRQGV